MVLAVSVHCELSTPYVWTTEVTLNQLHGTPIVIVRDTHPATSSEELYQRPTILNSHHIHSIRHSEGFVKQKMHKFQSFFPLCIFKNVYRMYSVKPSILNIPHSEGIVKSLS